MFWNILANRTIVIAMLCAAWSLLTPSAACAQTAFGPGYPTAASCHRITVPAGKSVSFSFAVGGNNENMVAITEDLGDGRPRLLTSKGNYSRSQGVFHVAAQPQAVTYVISGWCKDSPPDGKKPWLRSKAKVMPARPGVTWVIGFDDSANDGNYTDATVSVTIK